jgi:hypothetical protein
MSAGVLAAGMSLSNGTMIVCVGTCCDDMFSVQRVMSGIVVSLVVSFFLSLFDLLLLICCSSCLSCCHSAGRGMTDLFVWDMLVLCHLFF